MGVGLSGAEPRKYCRAVSAILHWSAEDSPTPSPTLARLPSERIRAELEVDHFARRPLSSFHMERRARAHGRPEPAPLPPRARVIDAAVHPLRVETDRVGHAEDHPLAVLERE